MDSAGRGEAYLAYPFRRAKARPPGTKAFCVAGTASWSSLTEPPYGGFRGESLRLGNLRASALSTVLMGNYENLERPSSAANINTGEGANHKGNS